MSSPPRPDLAHRSDTRAAVLAARLDKPMGALGIVFMLVVLGQTLAGDPALQLALSVSGWILWAVFVGEFGLRLYVAEHRGRFLRHNWWQVLFLALPFLRFVRAVALLRAARAGGVVASAVRGSRSAGRLLTDRLGWLATVTAVVVLAASQLLYLLGVYDDYANALHGAALATIVGQPLERPAPVARVLEIGLALYSVVVFAGLAAAMGAFFLGHGDRGDAPGPLADGDDAA
ncbi:MAG: hypothetical protein M3Q39_05280 [Actinomycetota bacterium]|nr:hypothetical protein [Actinomycetota bacterium]MDQ3424245.1 hypothetical protein [Actinomycetota bacterium]